MVDYDSNAEFSDCDPFILFNLPASCVRLLMCHSMTDTVRALMTTHEATGLFITRLATSEDALDLNLQEAGPASSLQP